MKKTLMERILSLSIFLSVLFIPITLHAWSPINGIAISTAAINQRFPTLVRDTAGGAIITWDDTRNGSRDIYAQRVDSVGSTLWTLDGVPVSTVANHQRFPTIVPDGNGGAIITWNDYRSGTFSDIYAQRVNSSGSTLWTLDGVAICTAGNDQLFPKIVSDGSGGAIITWYDYRSGTFSDIYAQRVDSTGSTLWTLDGVAICTEGNTQQEPTLASDGNGGAIITWYDLRSGNFDIYTQGIDSTGTTLWTLDGVAICTAVSDQYSPTIVSDGGGGAIITWYDYRSGDDDIYVQRIDSTGTTLWTQDGVAICTAYQNQMNPIIMSNSSGGAIITWIDHRNNSYPDIYAQRITSTGSTLWTLDGVAICTAGNTQMDPTIASNGSGGAIITWYDFRDLTNYHIYAQGVDSSGSTLWALDGVAICTAANNQYNPTIVSDDAGGAIISWEDTRNGTYDIYVQSIHFDGGVPVELSDFQTMDRIKE